MYEGDFARDELHGEGRHAWRDSCTETGLWCRQAMHGQGLVKLLDGRADEEVACRTKGQEGMG